jgi:hypothetical protein
MCRISGCIPTGQCRRALRQLPALKKDQAARDTRGLVESRSRDLIEMRCGSRSGRSANSGTTSNQIGTQTRTASNRSRITSASLHGSCTCLDSSPGAGNRADNKPFHLCKCRCNSLIHRFILLATTRTALCGFPRLLGVAGKDTTMRKRALFTALAAEARAGSAESHKQALARSKRQTGPLSRANDSAGPAKRGPPRIG